MTLNTEAGNETDTTPVKKEDLLDRAQSAYEAVVAIAKEARRLNAVPGVYLEEGEKPVLRAARNFVEGKVEYEVDGGAPGGGEAPGKAKKKGRKKGKK
jgi:DNA-directed RNA polymerase subunit K/omega